MNTYERTYRQSLQPGKFADVVASNRLQIEDRWILINNVEDRGAAASLADALVLSGEITGYRFVDEYIDEALHVAGLTHRALRHRGYFLDYGLVMAITGSSPYIVGWDPETVLDSPADWITPGMQLLEADPRLFSVSPRWPMSRDTLAQETVAFREPWAFNYGFTDQVFLVRRRDIAAPIFRCFAPASLARSPSHPFSFEARVESHQRAKKLLRATHRQITFTANDLAPVIERQLGGYTRRERIQRRVLNAVSAVLTRLKLQNPRYRLP